MIDATGHPGTILLLGGTSEIGLAICAEYLAEAPSRVVLAVQPGDPLAEASAARMAELGATVDLVDFDARDFDSHAAVLDAAAAGGDIDVAIVAFALLGGEDATADAATATELAHVNFTGTITATMAVANRLRAQGHGAIMLLSSVAGERVRKGNPIYGATKAGIDGFAQGFGDELAGAGVHMLVVRPGFVHSSMTAGMKPAPFATTPEKVAEVAVKGLRAKRRMVWAPGILRFVFMTLRHVPGPIWRRLPLG